MTVGDPIVLVILTEDMKKVSQSDLEYAHQKVEQEWIKVFQSEKRVPFNITSWNLSEEMPSVTVSDGASAQAIDQILSWLGFVAWEKQRFEDHLKSFTSLSGVLSGPSLQKDRDTYAFFLKVEKERQEIPGWLELVSVEKMSEKSVRLEIRADDSALLRLKAIAYNLSFGASGCVTFHED